MNKTVKIASTPKYQSIAAVIVIVAAAILGYFLFIASHASTPFVSVEAENGTLDSGGIASKITDSTSSRGSAVQFGPPPATAPPPSGLLIGFYLAPSGNSWPPVQIVSTYITNACGNVLYTNLANYHPNVPSGKILSIGTPMDPDQNAKKQSCGEGPSYTYSSTSNLAAYTQFAKNLVAGGQSHAIIRIGWEWSGNWYAWSNYGYAQYVQGFGAIVTAMRLATGEHFLFDWNSNAGSIKNAGTFLQWYPGDQYVDIASVDHYDPSMASQTAGDWSSEMNANTVAGIQYTINFAIAHNKYMAFPEWGLKGLDDVTFVNNMAAVAKNPANRFYYASYFNSTSNGASLITKYANTASAFQSDFAGI